MELYDVIGVEYDTSRKADPQITERLFNHIQVFDSSPILDMLSKARIKSTDVTWDKGDVINLLYQEGTFLGATCILAIHHFKDLKKAFQEVYRVLNKGRFVIFTSSPDQMDRYWLKEYFPETITKSCNQMPQVPQVIDYLKDIGFKIVGLETFLIQPNLQDFFLYSGKYEPSIYLNPKVRAGISSFANLASQEEIHAGCTKLKSDIESGRIKEVVDKYSSDLGDYIFVVAEKR